MRYDKQSQLSVQATADARAAVTMASERGVLYHIEAYAPLTIWQLFDGAIRAGHPLTPEELRELDQELGLLVDRDGQPVVPIARLRAFSRRWLPPEYHPDTAWTALFRIADKLLWADDFRNLVVNAGLDDSLDKHLKGSAYTAAWYVGLTDGTPSFAAADTMASHAGWVDLISYSESVRQTLTLGTVSGQSVDNSASKAAFTIAGNSVVIGGAYVVNSSTKGGTTGTLYGGGAFTAADKTLSNGDTLNCTLSFSASAS